ncbi:hypothetical protein AMECASPLE_036568 [Ameca splendens]|uniref:Uncharacterized protein n=1 Tax=Ameca splendens TaxID=208324 RepID=A0ABV0Y7U1_9TELE
MFMKDPVWQRCTDYCLTGLLCHTLVRMWINHMNAKVVAHVLGTSVCGASSSSDSICSQHFLNVLQTFGSESSKSYGCPCIFSLIRLDDKSNNYFKNHLLWLSLLVEDISYVLILCIILFICCQ